MKRATIVLLVVSSLGVIAPNAEAKPDPKVVIAHIDTGINPYHEIFRDRSPLAYAHPSKYIPGYPKDAKALRLTLNAPSFEAGFKKDKKIWEGLLRKQTEGELAGDVFWIPGTRIIAATSFGPGSTWCPPEDDVTPPPFAVHTCTDYPILDDQGHGTMTASRMAGRGTSLCPECRIVSVEGLGDAQVKWVADQGWIDVQTNSWGYIAPPHPVFWAADEAVGGSIAKNLEDAAKRHLVYFASGNGAAFALGWTPWPTEIAPTLVDGAVWVGAHDNGRVAHWSGAPAHLVADGFKGLTAGNHAVKGIGPSPFACCTSAASPYAAGHAAAIVLHARRLLGDSRIGFHGGIAAQGKPLRSGPLADGKLTLDEARWMVKHVAQARPAEGRHDGEAHWASGPYAPDTLPWGPGGNAFCQGCWTLPIAWTDVPAEFPAYLSIGYGAANEFSLALAYRVLSGKARAPDRSDVDEFFANEAAVREVIQHPVRP